MSKTPYIIGTGIVFLAAIFALNYHFSPKTAVNKDEVVATKAVEPEIVEKKEVAKVAPVDSNIVRFSVGQLSVAPQRPIGQRPPRSQELTQQPATAVVAQ